MANTVLAANFQNLLNEFGALLEDIERRDIKRFKEENLFELGEQARLLEQIAKKMREAIDEAIKIKVPPREKVWWKDFTIVHCNYEFDDIDKKRVKEYLKENGLFDQFKIVKSCDYIRYQKRNGKNKK